MDVDHTSLRGDFRCGICRQKNTFDCEHDTPYRDQYLGTFDSNTPREAQINKPKPHSQPEMNNNSLSNGGMHTGRQQHSNIGGAQHQKNKKLNKTNADLEHANEPLTTNEQDTNSKSCVIL